MTRFVPSNTGVFAFLSLFLVLTACGSDASNGQDAQSKQDSQSKQGANQSPVEVTHALDGDLTYVLEGPGNASTFLRVKEMEDEKGSFEIDGSDPTSIRASLSDGRASGDLPDVSEMGDADDPEGFEIYKLLTTSALPDKDLTLKLLNDGNVVAKATAPVPGDDVNSGNWIIKVKSPNAGN